MLNKTELTKSVFEALNTNDFTELEDNFSDDVKFNFPGTNEIVGKKRVIIFMKTLKRKFPVLRFEIHDMLIDNNKACAIWTNKGENNEGEDYKNSGVTILKFEKDHIVYISDYFKDTSFTSN